MAEMNEFDERLTIGELAGMLGAPLDMREAEPLVVGNAK